MRREALGAAAAVGLSLTALACDAATPVSPSAGHEFELKAGETARIEASDLAVRFEGVPRDSRCPIDVQCIVAGDATVALYVTGGGAAGATRELHTTEGPREARHGAWSVALVRLDPVPVSTRPTERNAYVVTLIATPAS